MSRDFHRKPKPEIRCVRDALSNASRLRRELPKIVQVSALDWDLVILADDWLRQSRLIDKLRTNNGSQPVKEK